MHTATFRTYMHINMNDILQYAFMQRALIGGAMIGVVCSVLGVFVVLKRLSFISAGVSHAAFTGIALSLLLGLPLFGGTVIFCVLVALAIGYVNRLGKIQEDTTVGIFYAASMALGVFLISLMKSKNINVMGYLFGNILAMSSGELISCCVVGSLILLVLFLFYKEFLIIVFDEDLAAISGIPNIFLNYLLLVLVAVSIVISIKVVGIILVSALIVAPAAIALQLSRDFDRVVLLSALVGLLGVEGGLILSYFLNSPPGASITILLVILFLFAVLFAQKGVKS